MSLFAELRLNPEEVAGYKPPANYFPFSRADKVSLDLETHGLDPRRGGYIVGIGIQAEDKQGVQFAEYFPIRHSTGNTDVEKTLGWLRAESSSFHGELIGANLNLFDGDFLQTENIKTPAKWHDIQWAEPLLDEYAGSYSLETLAQKWLGEGKLGADLADRYGSNWKTFIRDIHPAHIRNYSLQDIALPPRILKKQIAELSRQGLLDLFLLEAKLAPMLQYMRAKGVRVNIEAAGRLETELIRERDKAIEQMQEIVGYEVDYDSGVQMALACDMLGITYAHTEKGNPSFSKPTSINFEAWIERQTHPFLKAAFTAKHLDTLRRTFIKGYILDGHINGRLHGKFHPERSDEGGTVTGRFSSSEPNLQNLPAKTEYGKRIRELFIPDEGMQWWSSDLSQIEFRLLVHYAVATKCRGAGIAQKMYKTDATTDFHNMVVTLTGLNRSDAKNINFGLIYGMGIDLLCSALGVTRAKGKGILNTYNQKVPFARQLYYKSSDAAQEREFIRLIDGRLCRFPHGEGFHKALNRLLQGSAAGMLKKAMVNIWEYGIIGESFRLYLTEHDELDGSVDPGEAGQKALKIMEEAMVTAIPLAVPVLANVATGANWGECK